MAQGIHVDVTPLALKEGTTTAAAIVAAFENGGFAQGAAELGRLLERLAAPALDPQRTFTALLGFAVLGWAAAETLDELADGEATFAEFLDAAIDNIVLAAANNRDP